MSPVRFTVVGHLTLDELEGGVFVGGSVLYAGLAARRLGADVRLVTSYGADFPGHAELDAPGVELEVQPAAATTRFSERYEGGRRTAHLLHAAPPLAMSTLGALLASGPTDGGDSTSPRVTFVAPVAGEVPRTGWARREGTLLAAGLQGWLRAVDAQRRVVPAPLGDASFLAPFDVVFCSDEDLGPTAATDVAALCAHVPCVVVTEGAAGARLYLDGKLLRVPAEPADEVDPTGAGDTFAACFLMARALGKPPVEAAAWGACGAARAIGAEGTRGLVHLEQLQDDVARYVARAAASASSR